MIVTIMNIHYLRLGWCLWYLVSGRKHSWVFLQNCLVAFWCCSLISPLLFIMNIHYPLLGWCLWCLVSGRKHNWVFLHNLFSCILLLFIDFPLCAASMFDAFASLFLVGCTCCSFCFCACFWTCWCMTCSIYFLRLAVTTLDIFWNQQVLGKPLHYFLT